jgi:hypothetical protein
MAAIATAEVEITAKAEGLIKALRVIEKHLGALAAELEQISSDQAAPGSGHIPGARPPRY